MQFRTKLGLVDVPNDEVLTAAREIGLGEVRSLHTSANRVAELFSAQYLRPNGDGGRVAHAMAQMNKALADVSALHR